MKDLTGLMSRVVGVAEWFMLYVVAASTLALFATRSALFPHRNRLMLLGAFAAGCYAIVVNLRSRIRTSSGAPKRAARSFSPVLEAMWWVILVPVLIYFVVKTLATFAVMFVLLGLAVAFRVRSLTAVDDLRFPLRALVGYFLVVTLQLIWCAAYVVVSFKWTGQAIT